MEDQTQHEPVDQDQDNNQHHEQTQIQDPFTNLMFGTRRQPEHHEHIHEPHQANNQSTINYEELIVNIDTLVESIRGLKPLFQKIIPFVEQIWKKK
ncbi:hypothetical protein [Neobacillus sp.]|uniref:hypothetical protein n=1 Tax=Neobacillus sp. TaxID=2675273 RepID=UPI0028970A1B|nr:hypothetical protein [Neobacillus sp.]